MDQYLNNIICNKLKLISFLLISTNIPHFPSDMSNDTKNAVRKFVKDMSKAPAPKQLAVGATAGWVAGYITMKVGKAAATMFGGSLLVLQIAHHKGMFNVKLGSVRDKIFRRFSPIQRVIILIQ